MQDREIRPSGPSPCRKAGHSPAFLICGANRLDQLIALFEPAADEFFGSMFGGFGEYDDDFDDDYFEEDYFEEDYFEEDSSYDSSYGDELSPVTVPDMSFDDSFGDLSGDAQSADGVPWDKCYSEEAAADAAACFQQYVATGELDETGESVALHLGSGLGLLGFSSVVDTHFSKRGRLQRLFRQVAENPELLGLGIDEDTAMVVSGHRGQPGVMPALRRHLAAVRQAPGDVLLAIRAGLAGEEARPAQNHVARRRG